MKLAAKVFLIISVVLKCLLSLFCLIFTIILLTSPNTSQQGKILVTDYIGLIIAGIYCLLGAILGIFSILFLRKTDQEIKSKQSTAIAYSIISLIFTGFIGGLMFLLYILIELENVQPQKEKPATKKKKPKRN